MVTRWLLAILWVTLVASTDQGSRSTWKNITIGCLLEMDGVEDRESIRHAIHMINSRTDVLHAIHLSFDIELVPASDSFASAKGVCRQLRDGVAAVIGPMSVNSAAHIQSICDAVEMPHLQLQWDFTENRDAYSINMFPYHASLSKAYLDFIVYYDWADLTVLYDTDDGLIRLQELLKVVSVKSTGIRITIRRLEEVPEGSADYRTTLKEIRNRGESRVILDCDWRKVQSVLIQAKSMNMTIPYYHYMLTTLYFVDSNKHLLLKQDLELVNLDMFRDSAVNITAYRLVNQLSQTVTDVIRQRFTNLEEFHRHVISTETALLYDAVHLFSKALDELSRARDVRMTSLSCSKPKPWEHGNSLINYMKMTQFEGLTGPVRFDYRGKRSYFALDLVELTKDGLEKIGTWNTFHGINVTKKYADHIEEAADSLKNKTLIVTTILEEPYMMLKQDSDSVLTGNDRFEGFCVDLLDEVSKILFFNYSIKLVEDGKYGAPYGPKQEWNGMVRELILKKADLAVASLTISYMREQVIDFTKPFMNLGISILFKKPEKKNPSLFSFLSPLSIEIWIYMLAAYLVVSFCLFVLARFSPYEWYNPHPCNPDCDVVENQFTLLNSLWFTVGSLMQQGSEVAPRAVSTRIVSGIWWFFTLILISSYTANLAAFLTVERMKSPIENAEDLSKQREIKYGTLYGGSTMTFFQTSKIESYERMWKAMSDFTPSVFVNSTEEGIRRVRSGDYAFLLESRMNEYITQRSCDLMQVGGLLDSKGYGIGTPRGSPYRDLLSDTILRLQEEQILSMLYNKWWREGRGGGICDAEDKIKKDANALTIGNVGGVFVVLVAGLALSPIVAVIEFIWRAHKDNGTMSKPERSMCSAMCDDLHFAFRCSGANTKRRTLPLPDGVTDNRLTTVPLPSGLSTSKSRDSDIYT